MLCMCRSQIKYEYFISADVWEIFMFFAVDILNTLLVAVWFIYWAGGSKKPKECSNWDKGAGDMW